MMAICLLWQGVQSCLKCARGKYRTVWAIYMPGATSTILKQNHFYVLDDHLNSARHEVIADEIIKAIGNEERREKKLGTSK